VNLKNVIKLTSCLNCGVAFPYSSLLPTCAGDIISSHLIYLAAALLRRLFPLISPPPPHTSIERKLHKHAEAPEQSESDSCSVCFPFSFKQTEPAY
jgi:hypothetical protein